MEFINNDIVKQFTDIGNSDFEDMNFDEKLNILKIALQKNIDYDNLNNTLVFFNEIILDLIKNSINDSNYKNREFGLFLTLASVEEGNYLFEPCLSILLSDLLDLFEDKHINVINLSNRIIGQIFMKINPYCSFQILNLFKEKISDTSWKKSIGCLKLISVLTDSAPEQIDYLLPELIPLITSQTSNPKREVKEESTRALNKCCSRISNPDVIPLIPKLVEANKDPSKTIIAIDALMETTFVNQVEKSTLAVIVPILNRGLKDRASKIRRKCCVVIDNMCKLVNDSRDVKPFEDKLLPYIISERDNASQPEVREMAGKATTTLENALKM